MHHSEPQETGNISRFIVKKNCLDNKFCLHVLISLQVSLSPGRRDRGYMYTHTRTHTHTHTYIYRLTAQARTGSRWRRRSESTCRSRHSETASPPSRRYISIFMAVSGIYILFIFKHLFLNTHIHTHIGYVCIHTYVWLYLGYTHTHTHIRMYGCGCGCEWVGGWVGRSRRSGTASPPARSCEGDALLLTILN